MGESREILSLAEADTQAVVERGNRLANSSCWEKCRVGRVIETHHQRRAFWWVSMTRPTLHLKNSQPWKEANEKLGRRNYFNCEGCVQPNLCAAGQRLAR